MSSQRDSETKRCCVALTLRIRNAIQITHPHTCLPDRLANDLDTPFSMMSGRIAR